MEVLIVGNGYAGSLLSHFLTLKGVHVTVTDKEEVNTSTKVSAGIMLPVTGRRLAKTYMADTVLPFAFSVYDQVAAKSGISFFHRKKVLQLFSSTANKNEWFGRTSDTDMAGYTGDLLRMDQIPPEINNEFGGIILQQSGYVDPISLLNAFNRIHSDDVNRLNSKVTYDDVHVKQNEVTWNKKNYDAIIFCEGYETVNNPWFGHLPFKLAKGEIIDLNAPGLTSDFIINSGIFILPTQNGRFRAGSTYEWDDLSPFPTEHGRNELKTALSKLLNCDFEIIDHKAGIRPTIRDRRPVLGFHPEHGRIGVFNGLGTKGAMLAPYFASLMSEYVVNRSIVLPKDFDVCRFNELI